MNLQEAGIKLGGEARRDRNHLSSIDSGLADCLQDISSPGRRWRRYRVKRRCL